MRPFRAAFLAVAAAACSRILSECQPQFLLGSARRWRVGDCGLAIANLCDLTTPFFQRSQVPSPVKDRQYPDLLFRNDLIDAVQLEPMHRCPAHLRESDSSRLNASTFQPITWR